ncbi:hypothetical protein scyTo_0016355, partial [Scyliorhinus torazame]|nr:hypothetical protein [Scyliorhinus torazame]
NRHILRILAQYGGGAHEVFDKNTKFSWKEKVLSQVNRVTQPGCSSISVKWERFNLNVPDPVQAPAQIHSVFSNSRLLIYGFVPHCTQATLSAVINNQEVSTIVSTTELQKTKGKILHRLTARALIGDYENGSLHTDESEHEMKKSTLKSYIIELSKEYSLVTQFTSFVAIEERYEQEEDLILSPSIQELAAKESVDILSYMDWDENFKHQNFKLRASKRELMEKWEVPNKFTKAIIGDDDYDDYYYDEMQSNTSPLVGSNGFRSVGLSASQDQNMANEKVLQQPPEETCLVTTDFHIFEMSTNFKGEKFKTSFQDPQFRSFRKLKKGREGVSSNSKIKMLAKNQRSFKKENEWPKKTGCFQKKKEDREKALRSKNCEIPWIKLLMCQNKTGYWNFTSDLGVLLEINVEYLTNVFLIERGIKSLGHRAAEEIVSLIATFLILQLIRFTNQLKGIKLTSLLCLDQTLDSRTACWHVEHVKKAIAWAKNTDRKYPTICSRLQLGRDWESATRQLLQIDSLKKGSPLQQLYNQEE